MLRLDPVIAVRALDGFRLWPIAAVEPEWMVLDGSLDGPQIGTAVAVIAAYNSHSQAEPGDAKSPKGFLRDLLKTDSPIAEGGLRLTDTTTGAVVVPGCCFGLESWREWYGAVKDERPWLGHDPWPTATRSGSELVVTADNDAQGSAVIVAPAEELLRLWATVERHLVEFHRAAARWAAAQIPGQARAVSHTLARVLDLRPIDPAQ